MIKLNDYDILKRNWQTLRETSKDDADKQNIIYMTDSTLPTIDFDGVKNDYLQKLK